MLYRRALIAVKRIERLHIHSNEINTKITMVTVLSRPYCCTSFNARAVISMDTKCKNACLIEARHFKHGIWLLYEEMNNIYDACIYLLRNQQSAIQRLVGLVQQYGVNTA